MRPRLSYGVDVLVLLLQVVLIFVVAFIYSNLGLGGGLLFVPILLSTGVSSKDLAVPISLTLTMATAASSVINHHRRGLVDFRLGSLLVAGALLGAVVGTFFTLVVLDERTFKAFFAAVLLLFGVYMVLDWVRNQRSVDEDNDALLTRPRVVGTAASTAGSGFLSGAMGIGGGLLNVPLLVYVLGRKTRKAIGTSSLLIIPTAAVGFAAYVAGLALRPTGFTWPEAYVLIPILMPVVFVGAFIGSRWGLATLKTRSVALIFIVVLFIAAAKLVYDLL
ncbi:MAG: sulfite exporter TauE/SafE family protein [Methanobacteriota archaeon]|nr:MAG: sulfite exporter TauE/SafE family protein [Euryarchaeota archaeon]